MRENAMFEKRRNRHLLDNGCEAESTHSDIGQFIFKPSTDQGNNPNYRKTTTKQKQQKSLTNGFVTV